MPHGHESVVFSCTHSPGKPLRQYRCTLLPGNSGSSHGCGSALTAWKSACDSVHACVRACVRTCVRVCVFCSRRPPARATACICHVSPPCARPRACFCVPTQPPDAGTRAGGRRL
eukprot:1120733-Rhodomonas_salina.1